MASVDKGKLYAVILQIFEWLTGNRSVVTKMICILAATILSAWLYNKYKNWQEEQANQATQQQQNQDISGLPGQTQGQAIPADQAASDIDALNGKPKP